MADPIVVGLIVQRLLEQELPPPKEKRVPRQSHGDSRKKALMFDKLAEELKEAGYAIEDILG